MNRLLSIIALLCCVFAAQAANFTEDFQTGLPTSASASETKVTLASGEWTIKNVYGYDNNGSKRARFNPNGYLITPVLNQPGKVTFYHRASGNGKNITVEKSTDGGITWTEIGVATPKSDAAYGNDTFYCNITEEDTEVLIRFTFTASSSGSVFIDDVTITLNDTGSGSGTGGGEGGSEDEPTNPDPQPEIEWTGPHSVEHCIYVASWAPDDNGDGSWENPYYNLQKAIDMAQPGDTIYVRGGTYYPSDWRDKMSDGKLLKTNKIRIEKNGDEDHWYTIKTFPGEFPVLNFKDQVKGTNKSTTYGGIQLNGNYWHIFGLHITQAGDNGIKVEGSHNKIERCTFSYNDDTGLQLGFGHNFSDSHPGISSNDGTYCAYNDIIDCDSYLNYDSDNRGSDADGFACKMHNGKGNRFIRCRAWRNADDAWDFYETDYGVKLIECWAWESAKEADFKSWGENMSGGSFQGNGNGFKLGGNSSKGDHEAWRCVVFGCNKTGSVKGFDQNSHAGTIKLVNCLAFDNGYNYMMNACKDFEFYNCVALGAKAQNLNGFEVKGTFTESNNATMIKDAGWSKNTITSGFSKDDYISLTEEDAIAPRAADGSLPTRFARLKSTSILIDKGLDLKSEMQDEFPYLWQPIYGAARDLGPYEYSPVQATGTQLILTNSKQLSLTVAYGNLQFTVPANGKAIVDLYTPQGILASNVATILATEGGQYSIPVSGQLKKGVYIARLQFNGETRSVRFTVK